MKRVIPFLLLILLLFTACGESVPAYTAPTWETDAPSEESTLTEPTTESTEAVPTPSLSDPTELTTYPADLTAVRLGRDSARTGDAIYQLHCEPSGFFLYRYDMADSKLTVCCNKKNCPHYDENCGAYICEDGNGIVFAVQNGKAYFAGGAQNDRSEWVTLSLFSLDLTTGERETIYAADMGDRVASLGGVMLCGEKAVLCYTLAASAASEESIATKQQRILAFDLADGTFVTVLERELEYGGVYNLWGMNETSLIVAYHLPTSGQEFPAHANFVDYGWDYDSYSRNLHGWTMLEYPLEESPDHGKAFAYNNAQHELHLYNFNQFYGGKLYYFYDRKYVKVYDPATKTGEFLFEQSDITYMTCLDGRIFYETDEGYFWYEIATGVTHQYWQDVRRRPFYLLAETDDDFICQGYLNEFNRYRISKADFYNGNYDAAVLLDFL